MYFGSNIPVNTLIGELVHGIWKGLVPHTNYVELDLVFCKYWNINNALRKVSDKAGPAKDHPIQATIKKIRKRIPLLLTGYFFGHIARNVEGVFTNTVGPAKDLDMKPLRRFPDFRFGARIRLKER